MQMRGRGRALSNMNPDRTGGPFLWILRANLFCSTWRHLGARCLSSVGGCLRVRWLGGRVFVDRSEPEAFLPDVQDDASTVAVEE